MKLRTLIRILEAAEIQYLPEHSREPEVVEIKCFDDLPGEYVVPLRERCHRGGLRASEKSHDQALNFGNKNSRRTCRRAPFRTWRQLCVYGRRHK